MLSDLAYKENMFRTTNKFGNRLRKLMFIYVKKYSHKIDLFHVSKPKTDTP